MLCVATGEWATESAVIHDGLRVLLARDRAVEDCLRKDVAAAHAALRAACAATNKQRSRILTPSTHGRIGPRGSTSSTGSAALSVMGRDPSGHRTRPPT